MRTAVRLPLAAAVVATAAALLASAGSAQPAADASAPRAAPGAPTGQQRPGAARELRGFWTVERFYTEAASTDAHGLTDSLWIIGDGELVLESASGDGRRFAINLDENSDPQALQLHPVDRWGAPRGWLIFRFPNRTVRDRLTVAFEDSFVGRPAGFDPYPRRMVLELSKSPVRPPAWLPPLPRAYRRDPCVHLLEAKVGELFGGPLQFSRSVRGGELQCDVARADARFGRLALRVGWMPPEDYARERSGRRLTRGYADESDLDPSAYSEFAFDKSEQSFFSLRFYWWRDGARMELTLKGDKLDPAPLRLLAKRVLSTY
ncbi:MAG: hypothetical protein ACREVR_15555 [Burkholderiales bacterium]